MALRLLNILIFLLIAFSSVPSLAQINSRNAEFRTTEFGDSCFIFCGGVRDSETGSLTAISSLNDNSTFIWEKYDTLSASFQLYPYSNINDTLNSTITNLSDGCYKVTISDGNSSYTDQAWVLNNWIEVTNTDIPDSTSTCDEFKIEANFEYAPLRVFDTDNNNAHSIRNKFIDFDFKWTHNGELVRSALDPLIYPPIPSNTPLKYELTISDQFGCEGKGSVDYISKVTKADFSVDPMKGEAVLPIEVANTSVNYDSTIWFFYKSKEQLTKEFEAADGDPIDSIDFILYDDQPSHEYERSGKYRIKLATVKINTTGNCYDTLFMEPGTFIEVDTSLVQVPNVFTPNNDGTNDVLMIYSKSLKSITFKVYNRWGGLVHSWKYSNIRSSDYTYEHAVWDGRIGNKMATPGVYFWVIRGVGRDLDDKGREKQINEEGFFHLFRDKE